MRLTHRLPRPLPGKILILVGTGILVLGLLALSLLLSLSRKAEFNQSGCTGSNIAPELSWTNVPAGTKSFVMLMSDYDAPLAGGWEHWLIYNIPAGVRTLKGNHAFTEGMNSFGFIGYGGPCPPATGETHHYLFLLYATDIAHVGGPGLKFGQIVSTLGGHVLGATSIIGTFHLPQ